MKISRTISIDFEDLIKINEIIKNGYYNSLSAFVQTAIKNELNGDV